MVQNALAALATSPELLKIGQVNRNRFPSDCSAYLNNIQYMFLNQLRDFSPLLHHLVAYFNQKKQDAERKCQKTLQLLKTSFQDIVRYKPSIETFAKNRQYDLFFKTICWTLAAMDDWRTFTICFHTTSIESFQQIMKQLSDESSVQIRNKTICKKPSFKKPICKKTVVPNTTIENCPICLDELQEDVSTLPCLHKLHTSCKASLKSFHHHLCPICRKSFH